jgi:glycosyltransferase involved in cell wall biosynthesis
MKPATILYINPFAQEISGPDASLLALIRNLDQKRFRPLVWIPAQSPFAKEYLNAGAKVLEFPTPAIRRNFSPLFWWKFFRNNLQSLRTLHRIVREEVVQLIHTNMEVILFSGIYCKKNRLPHIYHVRGTSFYRPRWLGMLLSRFLVDHAEWIFCISKSVRELLPNNAEKKITTLYNPIDAKLFQLTDYTLPFNSPKKKTTTSNVTANHDWLNKFSFIVGTAGRINPRKDLETFIRGAAKVKQNRGDIGFMIVGGTSDPLEEAYLNRLKRLSREVGVDQHLWFTGVMKEMPQVYGWMDICCLLSESEGFGRVLAEAAVMGRGLIGTRVGGIQEIIDEHKTGLLISPKNPAALAQAILEMVQDPEKLRKMGRKSRDHNLARFDAKQYAHEVMTTYENLLKLKL